MSSFADYDQPTLYQATGYQSGPGYGNSYEYTGGGNG